MTLARTVVLLAGALAVMLTMVIIRAETTRLHFEYRQLEREAAALRQTLREKELELARLRNPARIRDRFLRITADQEDAP